MNPASPSVFSPKAIKITRAPNGSYQGYLVIYRFDEVGKPIRYGLKIPIPGVFNSGITLSHEGEKLYARYRKGAISIAPPHVEKMKCRGYKIIGTARFNTAKLQWEPSLEIKKIEEPNKGETQSVTGAERAFAHNLFSLEETAAKFAVETGNRMVLGLVNGLTI